MLPFLTQTVEALEQNQIQFPRLGLDLRINSVAFTIGRFSVTWYGILITIGMMLAMLYGFRRMREFGLDSDRAIDAVIGGVFGGIIGARVYYVAFHWDEYKGSFKSMLNIRGGGLAIYGGVIGALLVGALICKLRKVRLLPMFDVTSLGFLIGQCIGRWGNFMNHEAFGTNTDGLFGMSSGKIQSYIMQNLPGVDASRPVHPCFLYESCWCLLGFILLHIVSKKWRKYDGQIFLMYVVWYGTGRFFIEGLRTDSLYLGTIRVSQALALISAAAGLVLLLIGFSRTHRMGTDYVLYVNSEESKRLIRESEERAARDAKRSEISPDEEKTSVLLADAEDTAEEAAETAADTAEKLTDAAEDTVTEAAADAAEQVTEAAADAAEEAAETAADTAEKLSDAAEDAVTEAAADAAEQITEAAADAAEEAKS